MRIAIVSDIHGNRAAFEAVLADLRQTSPDLILHGGDLAHGGASPRGDRGSHSRSRLAGRDGQHGRNAFQARVVDGVCEQAPQLRRLWKAIEEMAAATREALGEERIAWLGACRACRCMVRWRWCTPVPRRSVARTGARKPAMRELESVYSPLGRPGGGLRAHPSLLRPEVSGMIVANTGSVGLSYDGDRRAAYLLLDDWRACHPARGVRRSERGEGASRLPLSPRGLGREDARKRRSADAVASRLVSALASLRYDR